MDLYAYYETEMDKKSNRYVTALKLKLEESDTRRIPVREEMYKTA